MTYNNKEQQKAIASKFVKVANMLARKEISLNEAIEKMQEIDNERITAVTDPVVKKVKVITLEDRIEELVKKTVKNAQIEEFYQIMHDMNWHYAGKGLELNIVTRGSIQDCIEMNCRIAIKDYFKKLEDGEQDPQGFCATGGFEAYVCVDEFDCLNCYVKFVPYNFEGAIKYEKFLNALPTKVKN